MEEEETAGRDARPALSNPSKDPKPFVSENSISKPRKLSYKEKQEFELLEKEIANLEAEKNSIELALSGAETDAEKIMQLSARMGELIKLIDEKSMRWLELSEI